MNWELQDDASWKAGMNGHVYFARQLKPAMPLVCWACRASVRPLATPVTDASIAVNRINTNRGQI